MTWPLTNDAYQYRPDVGPNFWCMNQNGAFLLVGGGGETLVTVLVGERVALLSGPFNYATCKDDNTCISLKASYYKEKKK